MSSGPADKVLEPFKTLVWDVFTEKATGILLSKISWGFLSFLSGPLNSIIAKVLAYFSGVLYELLRDTVNLNYIMLSNQVHHAAYVKASDALRSAFDKFGPESTEFQRLKDEKKKALSTFVRFL